MGRAGAAVSVLLVEDAVAISHRVADWLSQVPRPIFVPKPCDPEDGCTLLARLTAGAAS